MVNGSQRGRAHAFRGRRYFARAVAAAALLGTGSAAVAAGTTERVAIGPRGAQANDGSFESAVSADGRFVAFTSDAANLVRGDTNGARDVFVRDRQARTTTRVSLGSGGAQANSFSLRPRLSADGRYVAFVTRASNLVPGDTNNMFDVFVRDRRTGRTERVSVGQGGAQAGASSLDPAISPGGRYVAFNSSAANLAPRDTNETGDVFLRDRETGVTELVSVGLDGYSADGPSGSPAVSAFGRFVAFTSAARNLVPGGTNGDYNIFLRDRAAGTTSRISLGLGGAQANGSSDLPALSSDGRLVAFASSASNLVAGDTNGKFDVFVRDRRAARTIRVSVGMGGAQASDDSLDLAIAPGGNFVAYASAAANLVPGDTNGASDVFVRDLLRGRTARVSLGAGGSQADAGSGGPAIAAGATAVSFFSEATNLVPGDTNGVPEIFVRTSR